MEQVTRAIDIETRRMELRGVVKLAGGSELPYDRLIVSPGIDLRWGAIAGYDEKAASLMHELQKPPTRPAPGQRKGFTGSETPAVVTTRQA